MCVVTGILADSVALEWAALVMGALGLVLAIAAWVRDSQKDTREMVTQIVTTIIDARFAAFDAAQAEIQRRLGRGDQHFDDLNDRDRKLETALLSKLSDMKDWMHDTFATKDDYQGLAGRFDGFQRFIAKMETERRA